MFRVSACMKKCYFSYQELFVLKCDCCSELANYLLNDKRHLVGLGVETCVTRGISLHKYYNHNMAKAIILTEKTSNATVDKVRGHGKKHGELGELSYWTDHYHQTSAKTQ